MSHDPQSPTDAADFDDDYDLDEAEDDLDPRDFGDDDSWIHDSDMEDRS